MMSEEKEQLVDEATMKTISVAPPNPEEQVSADGNGDEVVEGRKDAQDRK